MGNIQSGVEELVSDFSNMKIVERLRKCAQHNARKYSSGR